MAILASLLEIFVCKTGQSTDYFGQIERGAETPVPRCRARFATDCCSSDMDPRRLEEALTGARLLPTAISMRSLGISDIKQTRMILRQHRAGELDNGTVAELLSSGRRQLAHKGDVSG